MILRSCYIENYGTFSQKTIDFQEELTVFCEDNGYGKTTLVSFLKAMFYGLPSYKTSSKGFPERQHFYPFNGGKFGGNLTFEHEGKVYRVERFFDKKSDTKDECRVFCDSLETQEFGRNGELLGRAVFKIDEDSFVRTVFIEEIISTFSMTTDIGVALNRLVDDTDDDRNFEQAMKLLKERRKSLHTERGHRGMIPEAKTEIRELEEKIGKFKNIQQKELESRYEEKKEAHRASEQAAAVLNLAMQKSYWDIYDQSMERITEKQKELDALSAEYPHGVPTHEEMERLTSLLDRLTENLIVSKQVEDSAHEKRRQELSNFFGSKRFSLSDLAVIEEKNREIERLKIEIQALENSMNADQTSFAVSRFEKRIPSDSEIAQVEENVKLYRENQIALQTLNAQTKKTTVFGKAVIGGFVGGGLLLFGLVAMLFLLPLGIASIVAGTSVCASSFVILVNQKRKANHEHSILEARVNSLQHLNDSLQSALVQMLSAFHYPIENDIIRSSEAFLLDVKQHLEFLKRQEKSQKDIDEKARLCHEKEKEVIGFFADYPTVLSSDIRQATATLRTLLQEYNHLLEEKASFEQKKAKAGENVKRIIDEVHQIYIRYGIPLENETLKREYLSSLVRFGEREKELKQTILSLQGDAEKYKQTYQLTERIDIPLEETLDFYKEESKKAQVNESDIESRIRNLEFELEELPETENKLAREREALERMEKAYRTISLTEEFLQKAEQNLMDRYVTPVRDSFCTYASLLDRALYENVKMDKEYRISFERGGELRSDKHLSMGQYALSALCMRLALAERIYNGQIPFLVLDDPFIHLDEKHLKKALSVLSALAKNTQILYFTCHSVRAQFEN